MATTRLHVLRTILAAAILLATFVSPVVADDLKDAKEALATHGIQVVGSILKVADEGKLGTMLRDSAKSKKALLDADKDFVLLQKKSSLLQNNLAGLKKRYVQVNAQLANVNKNNFTLYNRLVSISNATVGQIELATQQDRKLTEQITAYRKKLNLVREDFIKDVIDMRQLAEKVADTYRTKASENDVQEAIALLSKASGKEYNLTPSRTFQGYQRSLKKLEDTVLSEKIDLRKAPTGGLYVPVAINDQKATEMVIDSGSSLIILPQKTAQALGVSVTEKDPIITLVLANGQEIQAKEVVLPTVRVGKFIVENVRCGVLGADAVAAEPILGMSFLGDFKFEINAQTSTLTMVKVETPGNRPKKKR